MEFLNYLKGEWLVISQAPVTFITGAFLVGLIVYGFVRHQFSDRLATLDERIRLKDDRLNEYASKPMALRRMKRRNAWIS